MRRRMLNDKGDGDFLRFGENLFNFDTVEKGVYIKSDGTFGKQSNYGTSDYIKVEPGALYMVLVEHSYSGNTLYGIQNYSCLFNENKEVIGGGSVYTQTYNKQNSIPFGSLIRFCDNVKYIRFSSTIDGSIAADLQKLQIRRLLED